LLEAAAVVVKDQSFKQSASGSGAEKRMVAVLGYVDTNYDIFFRPANLLSELTELSVPLPISIAATTTSSGYAGLGFQAIIPPPLVPSRQGRGKEERGVVK